MTNTRTYFELAQLAEASYANLTPGKNLAVELKNAEYMTDPFSPTQADFLTASWDVAAHRPNTDSGFSSTLFRNVLAGDGGYVLAIRGTEGLNWDDLLATDIADIVVDGIAIHQTIDLYNEWQRLTSSGEYQAAYLDVLEAESDLYRVALSGQMIPELGIGSELFLSQLRSRTDIIIDEPGRLIKAVKFESSALLFDDERATGLGMAAEISSKGLIVTGHSLGGHLASIFCRLFPAVGAGAVTVNGAGFPLGAIGGLSGNAATNIRNLFSMLAGESNFPGEAILNLFGDKNPEFVTMDGPGLFQVGGHQAIFIEQDSIVGNTLGHAAAQMTDSLAVYDLFLVLEAGLSEAQSREAVARLNPIFESGSWSSGKSLESIVNALADTLKTTIRISEADVDSRDALYRAVYAIRDSAAFTHLAGKLRFVEMVNPDPEEARADFGHFLALHYLLPFKIETFDLATVEELRSLHGSLGDAWERDKGLSPAQRAQGLAEYSDSYLADRAFLLGTLLYLNKENVDHAELQQKIKFTVIRSNGSETTTFDSDAGGYPNAPEMFDYDRARYEFGSDDAEGPSEIVASVNDDRLYGMGANDIIQGLAGSDYIEGGTGNDMLRGDDGGDILVGGSGSDSLRGGLGSDYLLGGPGADRHFWNSGDGDDLIADYDDAGDRIIVNGIDLAALDFKRRSLDSPYYVDPQSPEITLHFAGEALTITIGRGPDAGVISVEEYLPSSGADFGIVLHDYSPESNPVTAVVVAALGFSNSPAANQTDPKAYYRQLYAQRGIDWDHASITFNATAVSGYSGGSLHGTLGGAFEGGPMNDYLAGNANQNALHGQAGDDRIEGREGHDFLEGGAGADRLFGGGGNDILFGGARAGLAGVYDPSTPYGRFYLSQIHETEDDVNILAGDAGNDYVVGGEFTDYMEGGAGVDYLLGGSGADYISGGADRDVIYGDSALHFRYVELNPNVLSEQLEIAFADGGEDAAQYDDVIHAGSGNDIVWGELGDDAIYAESGDDILFGDRYLLSTYFATELPAFEETTPDLASSLHGRDKLYGGAGADILLGLGGDDELSGGTGNDALFGGAGDDVYVFHAGDGRDVIQDTEGRHTLMFSGVSLRELRIQIRGEQVYVGTGPMEGFSLSKSAWDNARIAVDTSDAIVERSRMDTQYLDTAGNLLMTIKGVNTLPEAGRDDVFTVDTSNPERPRIVVKPGVDEVYLEGIDGGAGGGRVRIISGGLQFLAELAALQLETGEDFLELADGLLLRVSGGLSGTPADDWILGGAGDDEIDGYEGNDLIEGRGGNDTLAGGFGSDTLVGEAGDDRLDGGVGDDVMRGGDGADVLYGGQSWLERDYFDGGRGNDIFHGGAGSDTYRFRAGDGTDMLNDGNGYHAFEFDAGVDPASVVLRYTGATSSRARLEYGSGDAVVTNADFSAHWIHSVTQGGKPIPLVHRSDLVNGVFYDTQWHDIFEPGAGNDTIHVSGWGNDAFRFAAGGGQDVLKVGQDPINMARKGEIRFAAGVDLAAITYEFTNADAVISYGSQDRITLDTATVSSFRDNTFLRFTLASEADPNWIPVIRAMGYSGHVYGSFGTDYILGGAGADIIVPGYGNDLVLAGDDADRIVLNETYLPRADGGIGRKIILGQSGSDTITAPLFQGLTLYYSRGDGHDAVEYDWSYSSRHPYLFDVDWEASTAEFLPYGQDTLAFGPGIALTDLRFVRYGDALSIQLKDGSGSIRIADFFHAWDVERAPDAPSNLFALMGDSYHPDVDSLLAPEILAVLPRTPIARLGFADGSVIDMAAVLSTRLEESVATVLGTEGDDVIYGSEVDQVIYTFAGDDYIEDFDGSNTIDAGAGDDRIALAGNHILDAGAGDDDIQATGNNVIRAGEGRDRLQVAGNNVIEAGPGNDQVFLRGGHNVLKFGPGDGIDTVRFAVRDAVDSTILEMADGLTPADIWVYGYTHEDSQAISIYLPATGDEIFPHAIIGGIENWDYTAHPRATFTAVRFSDGTVISGEQLFAMAQGSPNRIEGTAGDDVLAGTPDDDDFHGGPGNDTMLGGGGSDYFFIEGHSQGADRISGGDGYDVILGGAGDDTFTLFGLSAADSIEEIDGGAGQNSIRGTADRNVFNFLGTQLLGIHHIDGGQGDDDIWGSAGTEVILGGRGNDTLRGAHGSDAYLFGRGDGRDWIGNYTPGSTEFDLLWIYDVAYDDLWLSRSGYDLLIDVVGTTDQVKIASWFFTEDRQLDAIFAQNRVLLRNQVDQLVNAMAGFNVPTGAGAVIPQAVQQTLEPTLAAVWQLAA